MNRPVHFEINVNNPEATVDFCQQVFGWTCQKWEGVEDYWFVQTGEEGQGINGGVMETRYPQMTVNSIQVASVDEMIQRVEAAGGAVPVPKFALPGMGWLAYCTDPNGVLFGLTQEDANAQ